MSFLSKLSGFFGENQKTFKLGNVTNKESIIKKTHSFLLEASLRKLKGRKSASGSRPSKYNVFWMLNIQATLVISAQLVLCYFLRRNVLNEHMCYEKVPGRLNQISPKIRKYQKQPKVVTYMSYN